MVVVESQQQGFVVFKKWRKIHQSIVFYISSNWFVGIQPVVLSGKRMPFHPLMLLSTISTFVPSCSVTAFSPLASGVAFTVAIEATITAWLVFRFSFCCILAKEKLKINSKRNNKAEKNPILRRLTSTAKNYNSINDRLHKSTNKLIIAHVSMLKE